MDEAAAGSSVLITLMDTEDFAEGSPLSASAASRPSGAGDNLTLINKGSS